MSLLIAFVLVPMIEIGLFIKVGGLIGIGWTLAIVLATAIAGSWLVRMQGLKALAELRGSLNELRDPTEPIAHGALILFAGALLLTPGFFTDTMGLLLLLPQVRAALLRYLATRVRVERFTMGGRPARPQTPDDVIDGEFTVVDPEKRPTHGPSGWTRH
ncbi:FxsA family protein [Albidovulum sediminicola]|uniref:FxsA family protein n=1 Tax=Albidovulum sediminicola TaxID=2984331 RepID=A0ABT2YWR5_9RHOB|nr:FxsA family protein [Defluviimonas sp. WL0075]MCV2863260.1 FxsA family protein [Defluviimonas sp. WL0075]